MCYWLLLSALAWSAKTDKFSYPPQRISASGLERIAITGVKGRLRLVGSRGSSYRLKVAHSKSRGSEDWNLAVERQGQTLVLEVSSSAYGREWRKILKKEQWPEFDLELEGPARPTIVSWREGELQFDHWQADVEASLVGGNVRVVKGRGNFKLQALRAAVRVQDFAGQFSLSGEQGEVEIEKLTGQLKVNWMDGPLRLTEVQATSQLELKQARLHSLKTGGPWRIHAQSGEVSLRDFNGQLRAQGQAARWRLKGRLRNDIELTSGSGRVEIDAPRAAHVFLTSRHGRIDSPFQVQDRNGTRVAQGRQGPQPHSQFFVRTESGDITYKY